MNFTVIGGSGFIGAELVQHLRNNNYDVFVPHRNDPTLYENDLGIVVYCAGHGDCVNQPFNVNEANVELLSNILQRAKFKKLIYLSSTRVYMNSLSAFEDDELLIYPSDSRRLFNLTKLVAEELCFRSNRDCIIVRPSNVYGNAFSSPLFLPSITRDAIKNGVVNMYVTPDYNKDYVAVDDLIAAVVYLSLHSTGHNLYNVASGNNTSAEQISAVLKNKTGCEIKWNPCLTTEQFPVTSIDRISDVMNFRPRNVIDDLSSMVDSFKKIICVENE